MNATRRGYRPPARNGAAVFGLVAGLALLGCLCSRAAETPSSEPAKSSTNQTASDSTTRPSAARSDLASFLLKPGFRIELVASEPMITAPVALAFDENGRLFVAEQPGYGERTGAAPPPGRVRVLEEFQEDGSPKTAVVFAEGVPWPSAIACYGGGVFVVSAPDLLFLKSSHGEGGADVRQAVLTGFGGTNTLTSRTLPNSLNWGLENRFYGVTSGSGGVIAAENRSGPGVSLAGRDFSFDPRTLAVFPETGVASSGLTFDNSGRRYVSDFGRPLRVVLEDARYISRNPFAAGAGAAPLATVVSPATPIFQWSPASVTNLLLQMAASGSFQPRSNSLVAAWLTNAQGACIYRGSAFPSNYLGNAFIPDPAAHVIHRVILKENGLGVAAERPPEERGVEFLVSKDPEFHPMQVVAGPDGALYVADLRNGHDQGRIYRICPANFARPKASSLGQAKTLTLVAALASNNGWHRDTASRLLFERQDPAAVPLLSNMLNRASLPLARLHALHALAGLSALAEPHLLAALRDTDATVREHGVLLCERSLANRALSDTLWGQLKLLAADPVLRVRYQLAFTVGEIRRPDRLAVLGAILVRDPANPWVQAAVLSSLNEGAGGMFTLLMNTPAFRDSPAGRAFLGQLATMVGAQGVMSEVTPVLNYLTRPDLDPLTDYTLLNALADGLHRTRSSLALVDQKGMLVNVFAGAFNISTDPAFREPLRVEAIRLLPSSTYTYADVGDWLLLLCNPPPIPAVQSAAISTLGRFAEPEVFSGLVKAWPALTPYLRSQAMTALLARDSRVGLVIDALERGLIPTADLSATQMNFLRTYDNPGLAARAVKLFGPVPSHRPEALEQFRPALRLTGAAERGRGIFVARCAACHRMSGVGEATGPDLTAIRPRGKEYCLEAIVEPNAHLAPGYETSLLVTKDGEDVLGIESDATLSTLTLNQPGGGSEVWPRLNIALVRRQPWSLMPAGLEQGLSTQDMADLLQFLLTGESAP